MTSHTNFNYLCNTVIAAGSTATIDLDVSSVFNELQLFFEYTFTATATGSGLTVNIKDGVGPTTTTVVYLTTESVTVHYDSVGQNYPMNPVTTSSGSPQTKVTKVNIPITTMGNWLKITIGNLDSANTCNLTLYGDF